ncbi:phosphotransferase family protein [Actinokineospora sp. 24-640]
MDRVTWADLPAATTAAVAEVCAAAVVDARPVSAGVNSAVAVVLDVEDGGRVFCKGVPLGSAPYLLAMFEREATTLAALPPGLGPRLLWQVQAGGWWLLGMEHHPGRPADLALGSPDLPLLADVLARFPRALTPPPAAGLGTLAARLEDWQVWARYRDYPPPTLPDWARDGLEQLVAANAAVGELGGSTLLHTDLNPHNWIIGPDGRTTVVDWAWACTGPAWAESEWLGPRLIAAGHTPAAAADWVNHAQRNDRPDPAERLALLATITGIWLHRAHQGGFRPDLADAALAWLGHRWTTDESPTAHRTHIPATVAS